MLGRNHELSRSKRYGLQRIFASLLSAVMKAVDDYETSFNFGNDKPQNLFFFTEDLNIAGKNYIMQKNRD